MSRGARLPTGPKPEGPKGEIRIPLITRPGEPERLATVSLVDAFALDLRGRWVPIAIHCGPHDVAGRWLYASEFRSGQRMVKDPIPWEFYTREDAERLLRLRWKQIGEEKCLAKIELEAERRLLNTGAPR